MGSDISINLRDDNDFSSHPIGYMAIGSEYAQAPYSTCNVATITPVLDTAAYQSGFVMSVCQEVTNFFPYAGASVIVTGLRILDEAKQKGAFDLLLFDANVDVGTLNQAYAITAVEARSIIGRISVAATDYADYTNHSEGVVKSTDAGFKVSVIKGITTSLYVATIALGTQDYVAATDVKMKLSYCY